MGIKSPGGGGEAGAVLFFGQLARRGLSHLSDCTHPERQGLRFSPPGVGVCLTNANPTPPASPAVLNSY